MERRPRIDLDGVPLTDVNEPYMPLAIFRYRTTDGLVLLIPESAEVLVEWDAIEKASVDLASARVEVTFRADFVATQNWLRGARTITGEWLDRYTKTADEVDATRVPSR